MQDQRRSRLSSTGWVALGSALGGLTAFLFQVVGTRVLGAQEYAPIGVLWTLQYLWVAVAVTALEAYLARLVTVAGDENAELRRFLGLLRRWLLATATVVAVVGFVFRDELFGGLGDLSVVLGLLTLTYGWYAVVRGRAAGADRFRVYGLATIGESGGRLLLAVAVLSVAATTRALAWVFPLGPLLVAVSVRVGGDTLGRSIGAGRTSPAPILPGGTLHPAETAENRLSTAPRRAGTRFLVATSTANAAIQFLIAGGPLMLVPLGADARTISMFFATVTAARVPMTFVLNGGLSRLLPPLTRMGRTGDRVGLRRAAVRLVLAIMACGALAGVVAALIGPQVLALVFGEGFRPDAVVAASVAVGMVLAVGGLLLDQFYIAVGRQALLPAIWLPAVLVAFALVFALPSAPAVRVAVGFTAATGLAVAALCVPLLRPIGTSSGSGGAA